MTKRALITGITGQSGSFLAALLLRNDFEVHGTSRSAESNLWRLNHLQINDQVKIHVISPEGEEGIRELVSTKFDMIFHLAAESSVASSFKRPSGTVIANIFQTALWLEAIRDLAPKTKFFNASSSEILAASEGALTEESPVLATNPYAVTKAAAYRMTCVFRDAFDIFAVNGILFNHESELRDGRFVTAKIVQAIKALANDPKAPPVELGNVLAERDFSHAEDFVKGMLLSLENETPSDYIFASGELCSIREFFNTVAEHFGFQPVWSGEGLDAICKDGQTQRMLAKINSQFFRPVDEPGKLGDPSKARENLGWKAENDFKDIIRRMSMDIG